MINNCSPWQPWGRGTTENVSKTPTRAQPTRVRICGPRGRLEQFVVRDTACPTRDALCHPISSRSALLARSSSRSKSAASCRGKATMKRSKHKAKPTPSAASDHERVSCKLQSLGVGVNREGLGVIIPDVLDPRFNARVFRELLNTSPDIEAGPALRFAVNSLMGLRISVALVDALDERLAKAPSRGSIVGNRPPAGSDTNSSTPRDERDCARSHLAGNNILIDTDGRVLVRMGPEYWVCVHDRAVGVCTRDGMPLPTAIALASICGTNIWARVQSQHPGFVAMATPEATYRELAECALHCFGPGGGDCDLSGITSLQDYSILSNKEVLFPRGDNPRLITGVQRTDGHIVITGVPGGLFIHAGTNLIISMHELLYHTRLLFRLPLGLFVAESGLSNDDYLRVENDPGGAPSEMVDAVIGALRRMAARRG
jgi:hypothetical protein